MEPKLPACLFLHANVNFGGWILADADKSESGLNAAVFERGQALDGFRVQLFRNGSTVDKVRQHCRNTAESGYRLNGFDGDDRRVRPAFVQDLFAGDQHALQLEFLEQDVRLW